MSKIINKKVDFTKDNLFSLIIRFSVPAAISLLITAIYNIVDRMFVGNFCGTTALAALSVCFPLSFMMIAFGLNCSAGGSSVFSIFSGKNERDNMNKAFGNAFVLVIVLEILLSIALLLFSDFFLKIFGVTDTTYDLALSYYKIVSIGCLFQGLTMVFGDFVRVSGKPIVGMWVTGIGAITNIILDTIFVVFLGLGVEGAAYATVIGQFVSMIFGAYLLFSGKTLVRIKKYIFKINREISKKIIYCGFAFWIAQMAMGFISLIYNSQLGRYGEDVAISVYAVISSVMTFVIMPASGISQGIQPIIGNNYGNGNGKRVMETLYKASIISVLVTCVIWVVVMIFPKQILVMFGGNTEMLTIGTSALRINFCITPILGFVMLATTFFQSLGKATPSIIITLLRQIACLVPFIYILPAVIGLEGIFFAQPISDCIALVISIVLIAIEGRKLKNTDTKLLVN